MPIRLSDIELYGAPISFLESGQVMVRVGPCSGSFWEGDKIPLDGRHYKCAGNVFLKNGLRLFANFEINTHTFDFLERDTVRTYIERERAWYSFDEDELYKILGIKIEDAMPYTWLPDRPLDYHVPGPYLMKWP